jgi:hypothetical protein
MRHSNPPDKRITKQALWARSVAAQREQRTTNLTEQGGYNFIATFLIRAKSVHDCDKVSNDPQ